MITYQSYSSAATEKLGENLAKNVLVRKLQEHATIIGLSGELGSGKTTFIQGFFRGMGLRKRALSPTFILMRRIKLKNRKFKNIFHIDAYRMKKPDEFMKFGFREIIKNQQNIILIEWADKLKKILPRGIIWLRFRHGKKENRRMIQVSKNIF